MRDRQEKLAPFLQALPGILQYQVFTKIVIGVWLFLMGRLFRLLLNSMGRVAVSTGDFGFLFTHWQGILIVLCAVVSLYGYVALDRWRFRRSGGLSAFKGSVLSCISR